LLLEDQKGAKVPIITSLDLLETWKESELISMDQYCNAMTMLRRSVYIFVPIHLAELQQYFDRASVRDGVLLETAELKAIREYLLKIRMTDAVKVPQEGPWLESVLRTFMNAIKDQWSHNIEENVAGARSDWLWAQVKALHWATVLPEDGFFINVLQQFKLQNMSLVLAPTGENFKSVREKYWHWMEQKVVVELKDTYPGVYEEILMWCGKTVSEVVMKSNIADDKND
jgi:hypothetical protein